MNAPTRVVAELRFLGSGNAFSPPGRMHALALLDGTILVDSPPTVLPQMRSFGVSPSQIRHLLVTHWHADHVFGFPFLILDRWKMGEINGESEKINIHCRPGGKERLTKLCEDGFPGTLSKELEKNCSWNEEESGELEFTDWTFERFPVSHTPATEPHGYRFTHKSGLSIMHCGDSGPCKEIENRAPESDIIILEMGVPDFVDSPHHHNPSDVSEFHLRHPNALILVTHNFARSKDSVEGFEIPELPDGVVQVDEGDCLEISDSGHFSLIKK